MKHTKCLLSVLTALTVFLVMSLFFANRYIANEEMLNLNVEALASSEGYSLGDCIFKSSIGTILVARLFCDGETDEYELHECKMTVGYETLRTGQCVFED